ncbi:MAG: aspartate aminotransferase family protein [Caldilineaceae bacterium]|nr:aspartate aminotransferase family protein [Caldilineaceae bacterium]
MTETNGSHIFFNNLQGGLPMAERGEGIYLYDTTGKRYIDGFGGHAVCTIGHGVPEIADAMAAQARKLNFVNYIQFVNEPQERLADHIIQMAPPGMDRVFFVPTGSTANEIALQLAREYQVERGKPRKHKVIGQWHNYFGLSVGALSMSGNIMSRRGMNLDPYLLNFPHVQPAYCYQCPFHRTYPECGLFCADDLARTIEQEGPDMIAAFIATPIVGGLGGAITPPPDYFTRIRQICDEYDILFIMDEVITGFGRLGTSFGSEQWQVVPDIITVAKTLSGGYAAHGAVIAHKHIWDTFANGSRQRLMLLSTFSGHPISCATSLAVQEYIAKHNLIAQCADRGQYLKTKLQELAAEEPLIGDVRGRGLFLGIEFVQDRASRQPFPRSTQFMEKVVHCAFQRGLMITGRFGIGTRADGDHISLAPPFIITEQECDEMVSILTDSIDAAKNMLHVQGTLGSGAV